MSITQGVLHDLSVHRLVIKCFTIIQIELEFGKCSFFRRGENKITLRKKIGAKAKTNNKLNPHNTQPGIEPMCQ